MRGWYDTATDNAQDVVSWAGWLEDRKFGRRDLHPAPHAQLLYGLVALGRSVVRSPAPRAYELRDPRFAAQFAPELLPWAPMDEGRTIHIPCPRSPTPPTPEATPPDPSHR